MKRMSAIITTALMIAGGITQAVPASASTTWDFANAPFTLSDGQGSTVAVTVQHMRVTGSSASGTASLAKAGFNKTIVTKAKMRDGKILLGII